MKLIKVKTKALIIIKLNNSKSTIYYTWKILRILIIILKEQMLYNLKAR